MRWAKLSCRSLFHETEECIIWNQVAKKWSLKGHLLSKLHPKFLVSCGVLRIMPSWAKFWRVKLLFIHFYRCQFWSLPVEPGGKAASRANNQWYTGAKGYKWGIGFREATSQKYLTFWEMISQKCKMICKWWSLFDAVCVPALMYWTKRGDSKMVFWVVQEEGLFYLHTMVLRHGFTSCHYVVKPSQQRLEAGT